MANPLAMLFAKQKVAGVLTGPIPDVVKPDLDTEVAKLQSSSTPKAAIQTGDNGVAVKIKNSDPGISRKEQVPSDAPHVDTDSAEVKSVEPVTDSTNTEDVPVTDTSTSDQTTN